VVSPCLDVSVLEIDVHSHGYIILGTDGLWNMLSPQDAVHSVYFAEKNNDKRPVHFLGPKDPLSNSCINPSKRLVDRALDRWMQHALRADNTSVVTVVVDPPPGPPKVEVVVHFISMNQ
jgi:protein phosphatase 1D